MQPPPVDALASAGKFCETALKYSHKAYTFMAAFKQSEQHAILLQSTLQEVNVLMRDLQRYIEKRGRPSFSESNEHSPVLYSIVEISKQFANDMVCLNDLLPYDIVSFSASVRKRTKFVLQRKETEGLLRRLEARKSSATLALALIGRINDLALQNDMASTRSDMQLLLNQQNALQTNNAEQHDAAAAQACLSERSVLTSIQALNDMISNNYEESARRQDKFADDVVGNLSEIQAQMAEILARQDNILSSQKVQVANAQIEASDATVLAQIVRHELQHQLKPLLGQVGREYIDRVANAFSSDTVETCLFKEDEALVTAPNRDDSLLNISSPVSSSREVGDSQERSMSPSNNNRSLRRRNIPLTYTFHQIQTKFGLLSIRLKRYWQRTPGQYLPGTDHNHTYFTLQVDIVPCFWISSRGLSAIYSSGPDPQGYNDILPSISTINIIPNTSSIYPIIISDDVRGLRLSLEQGDVTIRDQGWKGLNLLEMSLISQAPLICQYLLLHSGYGEQLVESASHFGGCFDILASCMSTAEIETVAGILVRLKYIKAQLIEDSQAVAGRHIAWWHFYKTFEELKTRSGSNFAAKKALAPFRLLLDFGTIIGLFGFPIADLSYYSFFIDMYLALGGDPNLHVQDGLHLLEMALLAVYVGHVTFPSATRVEAVKKNRAAFGKWCGENGSNIQDKGVDLITMLIAAGADIYHIEVFGDPSSCYASTPSHRARALPVTVVWEEALRRCGLNPADVYAESKRRLDEHYKRNSKLHGASRSGVDVEPIVEQPATSDLRQRRTVAYTEI